MKKLRSLLAGLIAVTAFALSTRAAEWTEDYQAALATAKAENKKVLLDFTGSDWCGWCMKIDDEVFSKPEFAAYAEKHLVLVKLDFPRKREMPDATKAQNNELKAKYEVRGYPTLIVIDPSEKVVFKQVGYEEGGPAAFIKSVENGTGA